jgi:1,6-anhydro-N-acetylmuramate kinase
MVTPPAGTPIPHNARANDVPAQPVGAPPTPRHSAPVGQQPVITNITPGNSPTR